MSDGVERGEEDVAAGRDEGKGRHVKWKGFFLIFEFMTNVHPTLTGEEVKKQTF